MQHPQSRRLVLGIATAAVLTGGLVPLGAAQAAPGCAKVVEYQDGTFGPVLCPNGTPNLAVQAKLAEEAPRTMALRATATTTGATKAICTDRATASIPMVINAYTYQYSRYQWSGRTLAPMALGKRLVDGTLCAS
ncbi:MAG: hypothetical protein PHU75_04485 [Candidatus Nanopelagicales bacterium]|nr:hypothetical protein [Candidatus Nanopelagicales bacterium]